MPGSQSILISREICWINLKIDYCRQYNFHFNIFKIDYSLCLSSTVSLKPRFSEKNSGRVWVVSSCLGLCPVQWGHNGTCYDRFWHRLDTRQQAAPPCYPCHKSTSLVLWFSQIWFSKGPPGGSFDHYRWCCSHHKKKRSVLSLTPNASLNSLC